MEAAVEVTKEQFEAFVKVRDSGKYNMFTEGRLAAQEANLPIDVYLSIMLNFTNLSRKFPSQFPGPLAQLVRASDS